MIQKIYIGLILFTAFTLGAKSADSQTIPVYNFDQFQHHLQQNDDSLYVINFWATWCGPCVKELPYFESVNTDYASRKVKVVLVSLDFEGQIESRLKPFLERKNIQSQVVMLDDPDANSWIDKVDAQWSGAIPATVIYSAHSREFYEKSFTREELLREVDKHLSKLK